MEFSVKEIAGILGGKVVGDGDRKIHMLGKIQDAGEGYIAFLSNPKYEQYLYQSKATAVIVKTGFKPKKAVSPSLVVVEDPYLAFTILLEEYHKFISFQKSGVEEPSYISKTAQTGKDLYRGAFSYIGNGVVIGNNVKIYPHAYIGDGVTIGDNTIIHDGVKIYQGSEIGNFCVLHAGVVIGSDGFGFAPQADGTYKTIPQLGKVTIEDFVHIGANTVIDCATFPGDATIIRKGVKLDNLIQIAHNVEVGKNTVIAAQSGISGSTKIGENCIFAGQVGIAGHLEIASKTSIGAQSGISKSIKNEGERILGSPAYDIRQYFKAYAVFKNLPEMNERLKQLEEKVLNLPTFQE